LYDGLNPQATGASEMSFVESDPVYLSLSEYDADRHFRRAAWDFVKAHPGRTLELAAIKLWRFWSPFPNAEQFRHPVAMVALAGFSAPVLALAACGAWRVRRALWAWLIPAAPILYFSLVHAVFVGSLRYRLPAEYALLPLAACGALALWHRRSAAGA
jgi:hypothetical protein